MVTGSACAELQSTLWGNKNLYGNRKCILLCIETGSVHYVWKQEVYIMRGDRKCICVETGSVFYVWKQEVYVWKQEVYVWKEEGHMWK